MRAFYKYIFFCERLICLYTKSTQRTIHKKFNLSGRHESQNDSNYLCREFPGFQLITVSAYSCTSSEIITLGPTDKNAHCLWLFIKKLKNTVFSECQLPCLFFKKSDFLCNHPCCKSLSSSIILWHSTKKNSISICCLQAVDHSL